MCVCECVCERVYACVCVWVQYHRQYMNDKLQKENVKISIKYICGAFNKFPDFFCTGIQNCHRLLKFKYVIAYHLMRWLTNFYDFRFKWTATVGIGIYPTEAWLSQLVNFKNAIWTLEEQ